ncbi:nucleoside hydrolase [Paenibacillus sp.]|uniref:nucleoside hydrolase n=1 Tax=Paenibacillus sp. TaxID=58172 RepID=UPI002D5CB064|nr:nucleoside hydrolase [Paenibacillus sp.]HZG83368.1 nucleoside hydrolase [Paenibacillus sp.]
MEIPRMRPDEIVRKLAYPGGAVRMVLDTDTYNEVDDQFALAYALASKERLRLEAVYAAPFRNDRAATPKEGMLKSYEEIQRIFQLTGYETLPKVCKGSERFLADLATPEESESVRDLIERAMNGSDDDPLYVVAIGAITNVVSAILLEPRIITKIVVVWLGGNPLHWPHTKEFNMLQDPIAGRFLFDCGVPLVQIPCFGVASHLTVTPYELQAVLEGRNPMCDALVSMFKEYDTDWYGKAKKLWDVAAIAYLVDERWVPTLTVESPIVTERVTWGKGEGRHFIKSALYARRSPIFRDLYTKLSGLY